MKSTKKKQVHIKKKSSTIFHTHTHTKKHIAPKKSFSDKQLFATESIGHGKRKVMQERDKARDEEHIKSTVTHKNHDGTPSAY